MSLSAYLSELFAGHGVPFITHNDWIVPNSELPGIRASWTLLNSSGRLDVEVRVDAETTIEECFAGVGAGDDALKDALKNFSINSFHVLLAAFWGQNDASQVETEEWQLGGRRF